MQTLKEQIDSRIEELKQIVPKEKLEIFFKYIESMKNDHLAKDAIKVGEKLPEQLLISATNEKENLSDIIDSPTIITFYRGTWCPYCNLVLKAYQDILPQIKNKGGNLIVISPELPDSSLSFKEKMQLEFGVYSDINNDFARKLGLVFKVEEHIHTLQKELGMDIEKFNGSSSLELPFPATIVVDKNAVVSYVFVDENYTNRAEPIEVLKELEKLTNK